MRQVILVFVMIGIAGSANVVPSLAQMDSPDAVLSIPPSAPLPTLLQQAQLLRLMRNGPKAVEVFRLILQREGENRQVAAMAQYNLGECLLMDFRNPSEAAPELQRVIDEYGEFPELVNSSRVRMAQLQVSTKNYDLVLPLTSEVIADGQTGRASRALVAWAMFYQGLMYEDFSKWAEFNELLRSMVENRDAAAQLYIQAINAESHSAAACEASKRLVDMLCALPLGGDASPGGPSWVAESKVAIAAAMAPGCPPEIMGNCDQADWSARRSSLGQRLAKDAERRNGTNEAIAWYRLSIADPALLSKEDTEAAAEIGRLLSPHGPTPEAEAWHEYLLNPATRSDPTADMVAGRLRTQPSGPTFTVLNKQFNRQWWLAELYKSQNRTDLAKVAYQQALAAATAPAERGAALMGVAECTHLLRDSTADQWADQAAQAWLQALAEARTDGDAHHAIEMAYLSYNHCGLNNKALAVLEQMNASLDPAVQPARSCFARFLLVREYVTRKQGDRARQLAEETLAMFWDRPFAQGHDWLCSHIAFDLAFIYKRGGDPASGLRLVDRVAASWPGSFDREIDVFRRSLQKAVAGQSQGSKE